MSYFLVARDFMLVYEFDKTDEGNPVDIAYGLSPVFVV